MSLNRKLRVLIADDIQETRRNIRLMVSTLDNLEMVAIASNGRQALEMTREHLPDIVLMDINMPIMDGLTAAGQILKIAPDIGCIIISGERDPETIREAMTIGIQEYLIKPFTIDELESAVERVSNRLVETGKNNAPVDQLRVKSEAHLKQLAEEYIKSKRTDDQSIEVFEQLVAFPDCDLRWMQTLAIIYALRQKWGKLKNLAEMIEQRAKNTY
jgi:YesN/AraC family two-component response regulator